MALFFLCLFFSVLVPFSLVHWKYSHYLVPCYPGYAAVAAFPLSRLSENFHRYYSYFFKRVFCVVALALLIFPLTTEIKRDKELFTTLDIMKLLPKRPSHWIVVNDVYPYYSLVNLMSWLDYGEVRSKSLLEIAGHIENKNTLSPTIESWAVLMKREDVQALEKKFRERFSLVFSKLVYFERINMMVLIPSSFMQNNEEGKGLFTVGN